MRVSRNLALIDDTVLVVEQELDRVFDRQDVIVAINVDLVDHRRKRCRLTGAGRSRNEDQTAGLLAEVRDDRRQSQSIERLDLVRDRTKHRADRTLLVKE